MVEEPAIAHQFWSGELTEYQIASMRSLQNAGFQVIVWSPEKLDLPAGILLKNSESILNSSKIKAQYFSYDNKSQESLKWAMYSDIFRIKIMSVMGGWWFDSDFFALKDVGEFIDLSINKDIVIGQGKASDSPIENSVISFPNTQLCDELLDNILKRAYRSLKLPWGSLGVTEINNILSKYRMHNQTVPTNMFYPIHSKQSNILFSSNSKDLEMAQALCHESLGVHWWNSSLNDTNSIPQNSYIGKAISML